MDKIYEVVVVSCGSPQTYLVNAYDISQAAFQFNLQEVISIKLIGSKEIVDLTSG